MTGCISLHCLILFMPFSTDRVKHLKQSRCSCLQQQKDTSVQLTIVISQGDVIISGRTSNVWSVFFIIIIIIMVVFL